MMLQHVLAAPVVGSQGLHTSIGLVLLLGLGTWWCFYLSIASLHKPLQATCLQLLGNC